MQLKILSWNIWVFCNFERIKDFLAESNADIVGLQEVKDDDQDRDVVSYMKSLGYECVFTSVKKVWNGVEYNDGLAIFSKYPIIASKIYNLSEMENRCAIRADIEVNGKVTHFFSTHLIHTHQKYSEIQDLQAENLLKVLPQTSTIIVGDFNATPESNPIKKMSGVFVNTDSKELPTWSIDILGCSICKLEKLNTKLDYIFTSKDIKTESFKVENDATGSDHLPISVIVEI